MQVVMNEVLYNSVITILICSPTLETCQKDTIAILQTMAKGGHRPAEMPHTGDIFRTSNLSGLKGNLPRPTRWDK